jgi:hypothetical protein
MKNILIPLIAIFITITSINCWAESADSLKSKPKRIIKKYVDEKEYWLYADTSHFGMDVFLTGGLGMTYGNSFGTWASTFKNGPAVSLGFEIPFTHSRVFAIEVYGYIWFCQATKIDEHKDLLGIYNKVSKNLYTQGGLSPSLKWYFINILDKVRCSVHLGMSTDSWLDTGFELYYSLNKNLDFNLSRRLFFVLPSPGGGTYETGPNYFFLNVMYKFRIGE